MSSSVFFETFTDDQKIGFVSKHTIKDWKSSEILSGSAFPGGLKEGWATEQFDGVGIWEREKFRELFLPYYTINLNGKSQATLLCVAKKKYGDIGDIVDITYQYVSNNEPVSVDMRAVIADHFENANVTSSEGIMSDNGTGYEISFVVHNELTTTVSWLQKIRERLFETETNYYTHKIIRINSIKQSESDIVITSTPSDFLLQPSDDERRYGINIHESQQQLIRFATSDGIAGTKGGDAINALKRYSEFLYYLLNSQVLTGNLELVNMPWLRPGFNVWVDPLYSDTVYYLQEVQHQGNPVGGASTSVSLVMGRPRSSFANDTVFGSMKDTNDNVFVNTMNSELRVSGNNGDGPWGKYISNSAEFDNIKKAAEEYYSHKIEGTTNANESEYHKEMYAKGRKKAPISGAVDQSKIFNGEYTADEIRSKIDSIYASAPEVVQERIDKLKNIVAEAKKYIELHYDKEVKA